MSFRRFALYFVALAACAIALFPRLAPVAAFRSQKFSPALSPATLAALQPGMPMHSQSSPKLFRRHRKSPSFTLLAGSD